MEINDFLTKYRFNPETDLINEGGFGKIYRAWGEHDQEVAIKVCHVQNNKYTLKREFDLASKLSKHPNIAYYENVFEFDIPGVGRMEYAVMQYYPDGDLRKVIETRNLTEEEKFDILKGILQGVSFLHKSGIIHRDLKPGNVLMQKVQGKWRPKITDFGLGKAFSGVGEISNTSSGIVSLLYASPEQILGTATLPNTDLWPIGVITYLLFKGKVPFESELPKDTESYRADLTKKIVSGTIPEDIDSIPRPYFEIIKKCLIKDSKLRVANADALLKILEPDEKQSALPFVEEKTLASVNDENRLVSELATGKKPVSGDSSKTVKTVEQDRKKKRRISAVGWIGIFILVVITSLTTLYFLGGFDEIISKYSTSDSSYSSSSDSSSSSSTKKKKKKKSSENSVVESSSEEDSYIENQKAEVRSNYPNYFVATRKFEAFGTGGIYNGKVFITNKSNFSIDWVTIEVSIFKANGGLYDIFSVTFENVPPNTKQGKPFPSTDRGTDVDVRISSISVSEIGLSF